MASPIDLLSFDAKFAARQFQKAKEEGRNDSLS